MNSRERMIAALECRKPDYTPCSFMMFFNLYFRCKDEREYIEREVELGLDPHVHVGHLNHTMHMTGILHPDATYREWVEEKDGIKYFCRRIDTPKGPLTGRVRQRENWPTEGNFPLLKDYVVTRAEEIMVKPEEDLEKLPYIFGPFKNSDVAVLRDEAKQAKALAEQYQLLQVGGWKGTVDPTLQVDPGVMGCDAMAWLSGYVDIMTLSLARPDIVREYAEIIHRWNMRQLEIYLDVTDAELILRRAWYESTQFWTPEVYRSIIAPIVKREADLVHQAGRKYGYIISQSFIPILDDILNTGIDVLVGLDPFELKGSSLGGVKQAFAAKQTALWGGVSGSSTVEMGTEQETEEAVVTALKVLGEGGGFILSPVDNVRDDTENAWKNTDKFIETWKKHRR